MGYAMVKFENCRLYLDKEHARHWDTTSSVSLPASIQEAYSGKWVAIVGTYSSRGVDIEEETGSFTAVEYIDAWPAKNMQTKIDNPKK